MPAMDLCINTTGTRSCAKAFIVWPTVDSRCNVQCASPPHRYQDAFNSAGAGPPGRRTVHYAAGSSSTANGNCTEGAINVGPFTVRLFTIFGATLRSLYGSQPAVVQNVVSPIICAWCVKILTR